MSVFCNDKQCYNDHLSTFLWNTVCTVFGIDTLVYTCPFKYKHLSTWVDATKLSSYKTIPIYISINTCSLPSKY